MTIFVSSAQGFLLSYLNIIFRPLIRFKFLLVVRIILSIRSNSSLTMWVAIELNIVSFLPIICLIISSSLEMGLKYFLIQRWGSILFLFLSLQNMTVPLRETIIIFIIILKLGGAPLHGWFVSILMNIGIKIYVLLATLQKIIPLIVVRTLFIRKKVIILFILSRVGVIIINLSIMRLIKILAYSRINRITWLIISIYRNHRLFIVFFIVYSIILLGANIILASPGNTSPISIHRISSMDKVFLLFIFLSLGGIPPFLGFITKLIVIKFIAIWVNKIMIIIILFGSFIILYIYLGYSYRGLSFYSSYYTIRYAKYRIVAKTTYFIIIWFTWVLIVIAM